MGNLVICVGYHVVIQLQSENLDFVKIQLRLEDINVLILTPLKHKI